jgi:hypothetical protein
MVQVYGHWTSAYGTWPTLLPTPGMSALRGKADVLDQRLVVRL